VIWSCVCFGWILHSFSSVSCVSVRFYGFSQP